MLPEQPSRKLGIAEILGQGVLLIALLSIAFPGAFLRGEMLSPADLLYACAPWTTYSPSGWQQPQNLLMPDCVTAFLPWHFVYKQALHNGEWPLWNPLFMTGVPLLANFQSGVLYPLTMLYSLFDLHVATTIHILAKLWLAGMAAYTCARVLGMKQGSACFLSIAWMLGGFTFIWCYWPIPDTTLWFPFTFLGTELILHDRLRKGFYALLAGTTLGLLGGHPETWLALALGTGLYFVLRLACGKRSLRHTMGLLAAFASPWILACLVASAQLLPFIEYLAHRATSAHTANAAPLPGFDFTASVCLWFPRFFGLSSDRTFWGSLNSNFNFMLYAGLPVWIALSIPFAKQTASPDSRTPLRERIAYWFREERSPDTCLIAVTLFSLLLAFDTWPVSLLHQLPPFCLMKHGYHVAFAMFALPLLAARRLDQWNPGEKRTRLFLQVILFTVAITVFVALIHHFSARIIHMLRFDNILERQFITGALIASGCLVVLFAASLARCSRWLVLGLTALLAIDLLTVSHGLNPTIPRAWVYPNTRLTQFLQNQPLPCRAGLSEGFITPGLMTPYGIEDVNGYDAIYPARITELQTGLKSEIWNTMEPVYGVRYYLHLPDTAPVFPLDTPGYFRKVGDYDGLEVYENLRALPRAFLVGGARVIPDFQQMLDVMKDPSFKPDQTVLLETPLDTPLPETAAAPCGSAEITKRTENSLVVTAHAARDCLLVVADQYYPGWKAWIDGRPAPILPAYHAFRVVMLTAGEHTVEFRYTPWTLSLGLAISIVAMLGSLVCVRLLPTRFSPPSSTPVPVKRGS